MWHRTPVVAGSFYPDDAVELSGQIQTYLDAVPAEPIEGIKGLIAPHAGYIYSGPVAAYSYRQLIGSGIELVIVLAPSHRSRFEGASVIPSGIYETPLGEVEIDSTVGPLLEKQEFYSFIKNAHLAEHSLEVQIPFLQRTLNTFKLVPVIVGTTDLAVCKQLAYGLVEILKKEKRKFTIVISTDLSHYYSYSDASVMDSVFIEHLQQFDPDRLKDSLSMHEGEACGEGPVITGMTACKMLGASGIRILKYANSGDTAGGRDQVVGYLSAVFT